MLAAKPLTYSEVLSELKIDSGHLSYHLENLGDLILHLPDNRYALSSFGTAAVSLMSGVEEPPTRHWRVEARSRHARLWKHKILLFLWILITFGLAVNLLVIPIAESRVFESMVLSSLTANDNRVSKVDISMKEMSFFSCTHNITLFLAGEPQGYDVKPELQFDMDFSSVNASGRYLFNFMFYYNDQVIYRRDLLEEISVQERAWTGLIVGPGEVQFEEEWNSHLKTGYNTVLMKTTIVAFNATGISEFQFGEGELKVEVGPARVIVRSLDADMDGIPDPIDIPYNNYALLTLFSAMCLPISAGIQFLTLKFSKKIGSYWRRLILKPGSSPALLTRI